MNNRKETIWNRDFILLLAVNAFVFISMHMMSTSIAKYSMTLNGGEALAGVVAGIFSVSSIIVRPICGVLIDRTTKKWLYLGSIVIIMLGILGYSISNTNSLLIAFRLVHGVGWGFATTIGMTMAADTAPEKKIGEATSIYGLANVLAMAVAPNMGLYLSENFSYRVMFLGGAAAVAFSIVLLLPVTNRPPVAGNDKKGFQWKNLVVKEGVVPALSLFLYGSVYTSITTFLVIYAKNVGIANPGIFFTTYSFCILVVRLCSGKIVDKKGPEWILVPGFFFFVGCLLLLSGLKSTAMLIGAAICLGFGYSGNLSTLMAVCFKRTGREKRGSVSSTINIGMDLGTGIGATVAGMLAQRFSYSALYAVLCIPVAMALGIFLLDQRCFKNKTGLYQAK